MTDSVVIVGASRTAMGGLLGTFQNASASDLGGAAIAGALVDSKLEPAGVDELIMGCVLSAGQGQAPARQAGFRGDLAMPFRPALLTSCADRA
jgi:acetyl-CoA C-acetyltransferase